MLICCYKLRWFTAFKPVSKKIAHLVTWDGFQHEIQNRLVLWYVQYSTTRTYTLETSSYEQFPVFGTYSTLCEDGQKLYKV
jgi:hypothetical protein